VKAGYFDEGDDITGIAHVLEHMYFKGTARRGPGGIARETKDAGGYLNAGTIYDHTSYYTVLPAASLEQALDIQADALLNSAIDAEELRTELQVIIQEARRKLDNPGAVAHESLFELLFDRHRIRRWRIGHADALATLTAEQVRSFYRALYTPENTIVVVAGNVEATHTFELIEKYYAALQPSSVARDVGPAEPQHAGFRFREMSGDVMQSTIEWGWRTPGSLHPDTPALDVLAIVLGQGRASRLYRAVREAGLATSISAYNYTPTEIGVFGVSAEAEPTRVQHALRAIAGVVRSVRDSTVTDDEIERARSIIEARVLRRTETAEGQANLLAEWEALGDWQLADRYMESIAAVTATDLQRVARAYLEDDLGALLVYRPESSPSIDADADEIGARIFTAAPPTPPAAELRPAVRADAAGGRVPRRMKPQRVEHDVRFYRNRAGANIVILPRHSSALVSMSLVCPGGAIQESAAEAGITALMARASVKGTARRTAAMLAAESEALGTSIGYSVGADAFDWGMTLPSRHFDAGLDLLLDAALSPRFPPVEVARERDLMLQDVQQLRDDMYQYPMRLALECAFGAHPYGFGVETTEQALSLMDAPMLQAWHRARVLRAEPWFFAVGDIADPDLAAAKIAAALSPMKHSGGVMPDRRPVWPTTAQSRVEQREKKQTAIALAFPGPDRNDPALDALRLLSSAVSGLGGRLFEELRSRQSLAYSVTAYPMARARAGAFIAYIGTSPHQEADARAGLLRELALLTTERLDDDEVERARRYTIGTWQIARQTNAQQLGQLASAILLGPGLAEIFGYEERILRVTAEDMRAAAAKYLDPARVVEGVVRGVTGGTGP
jgi:zinc protease